MADTLVEELLAADVLVIGLPIYNLHVPSTLKAWIDHVARAGTTFRYTSSGPEGLLTGKRAYVFAASGGEYAGTEADFYMPYLRHFLGFLGIQQVEFTYAEGLAVGEENSRAAMDAAGERIQRLAAGRRQKILNLSIREADRNGILRNIPKLFDQVNRTTKSSHCHGHFQCQVGLDYTRNIRPSNRKALGSPPDRGKSTHRH